MAALMLTALVLLALDSAHGSIVGSDLLVHYRAGNVDGQWTAGSGSVGTWENLAGASYDGSVSGATFVENTAEHVASIGRHGLSFDGNNDYVTLNSFANVLDQDDLTLEFWLYNPGQNSPRGSLYGELNGTQYKNYAALYTDNHLYFDHYSPSGNNADSSAGFVPTNAWTQIVITRSGDASNTNDVVTFYRNGGNAESAANNETGGSASIARLGARAVGTSYDQEFKGQMSVVRVYDRALGAAEVAQNYQAETTELLWVTAEDGNPPAAAGAVTNTFLGPGGTAVGNVNYSSDVAGAYVTAPGVGHANDVSLAFDNSGATKSYVKLDDRIDLQPGPDGGFTVEAYIKPDGLPGSGFAAVVGNWDEPSNSRVWMLAVESDGSLRFDSSPNGSWHGGNKAATAVDVIQGDVWQHVAAVYDPVYTTIYVDGEELAKHNRSSDGLWAANTSPTLIGAGHEGISGNGRFFNGLIDEVRITNRILAPSEFLLAVPEPATAGMLLIGLALLWPFRRQRRDSRIA